MVLSLVLVAILSGAAPDELARLEIAPREMRRFAEEGYFPLAAAALALHRQALAYVANAQTFLFFAALLAGSGYFLRRGFASGRVRGWSNIVWACGLSAICLAPSLFPELTIQQIDYAVTGSWRAADTTPFAAIYGRHGLNHQMWPALFILERGLTGTLLLQGFAVVAHDVGYRAKEALEDFGLIEAEPDPPAAGATRTAQQGHRAQQRQTSAGGAEGARFGQRGGSPPPRSEPLGEEAQARMVLGVSQTATRRDIERAYRAQIKRAHPDHGGSVERAAALNAARDTLLRRG